MRALRSSWPRLPASVLWSRLPASVLHGSVLHRLRVEQAAVVCRHVQHGVALVHRVEQLAEPVVDGCLPRRIGFLHQVGDFALGHASLFTDLLLDPLQAGGLIRRFVDRDQVPAFGIEQEQQPIQERQRGLEDISEFAFGWTFRRLPAASSGLRENLLRGVERSSGTHGP